MGVSAGGVDSPAGVSGVAPIASYRAPELRIFSFALRS
jgi:hypothetical protein